MTLLADQSSIFYTGPFWFQVVGHGAFFLGALYAAARLQADGLVKRASWRYWQVACLCLCLWTLSRLVTIALPESSDVGSILDSEGKFIPGAPRFQKQGELDSEGKFIPGTRHTPKPGEVDDRSLYVRYNPATEKGDPLAEGARFEPIGGRGEFYYYLQFDIILLLAAGVFALLALHDSKEPDAGNGEAADA